MLEGLKIKKFKGIQKGDIDSFEDINIFIGPNNSGKSTILDSIYILNHIFEPNDILGNHILDYLTSKKAGNTNLEGLHWKYNSDEYSTITPVIRQNDSDGVGIGLNYNMLEWKVGNHLELKEVLEDGEIKRSVSSQKGRRTYDSINEYLQRSREELLVEYLLDLRETLSDTYYIHSGVFQVLEQVEKQVWGGLYQDRSDKKVISKLNEVYGTNIDQLSYVPISDEPELQMLFDDYAAQPGSLGDGFRYAFALFAGIEAYSPSTILVEEPENHQHPSAYRGIAESISEYSAVSDRQFFITTHSFDFLNYLIDSTSNKDVGVKTYHLTLDEGDLEVRELDDPDIEVLKDLGIDPRRLEEYGRGDQS
ncbi:ATP-dependent nuclease [Natronorubrum sp. DTA28]|uniref:ATP-dependent nuclease n=1 Tax=Natronorubrum sp. DTA28 TaxID=3447019 RepID=UPI003F838F94